MANDRKTEEVKEFFEKYYILAKTKSTSVYTTWEDFKELKKGYPKEFLNEISIPELYALLDTVSQKLLDNKLNVVNSNYEPLMKLLRNTKDNITKRGLHLIKDLFRKNFRLCSEIDYAFSPDGKSSHILDYSVWGTFYYKFAPEQTISTEVNTAFLGAHEYYNSFAGKIASIRLTEEDIIKYVGNTEVLKANAMKYIEAMPSTITIENMTDFARLGEKQNLPPGLYNENSSLNEVIRI